MANDMNIRKKTRVKTKKTKSNSTTTTSKEPLKRTTTTF